MIRAQDVKTGYFWVAVSCAFFAAILFFLSTKHLLYHIRTGIAGEPVEFLTRQYSLDQLIVFFLLLLTFALVRFHKNRFSLIKNAFEALKTDEISIVEAAIGRHAIVSTLDAKGCITSANEPFTSKLGYAHADLIGRPVLELYPLGADDPQYKEARASITENRVWSGEHRLVSKDGTNRTFTATIVPSTDVNGGIAGCLEIRSDITAAREADASAFLTSVLEKLQDEVYIYKVETLEICYVNESARARTGWSKDGSTKKRISDMAATFDEQAFRRHVKPLFSGEKGLVTIEVVHPKGPVEISTRIIQSLDGLPQFLSVLRDLSWRKEVENEKLRSASMVSHELRAPLTSIHGALRLLHSGVAGDLGKRAQSIMDIACRNTDRLLLAINDILDLDKIKGNQMDFSISEIDLVASVIDVVELMSGFASKHSVSISVNYGVDSAIVLGNSDRIAQVLTNFLSNAIKFSPVGAQILVTMQANGDNLRVSVQDKGPGIPDEQRKFLFKPFAQLRPADGKKREGTGLGLAIVAAILARLEYPVGVNSAVGRGTEFFFDVPKSQILHLESRKIANGGM
jgi:two-component system sensor histidine kinase VicK